VIAINEIKEEVEDSAMIIVSDLDDVIAVVNNISSTLSDSSRLVGNITAMNAYLFGSGSGIVYSVANDLSTISYSSTPGDGFPSASDFNDAASGGTSSIQRLLDGDYDNQNTAEMATFVSALQAIYYQVAELPDYATTANNIQLINDTIVDLVGPGGIADELLDELATLDTKLNFLPPFTEISTDIENLYSLTLELPPYLDDLTTYVVDIAGLVAEIPGIIDELIAIVEILPPLVDDLLPVLYDLVVERTRGFNESIMKLPIDTEDSFNSFNSTLYDSLSSISSIEDALRTSRSSIIDVNITHYMDLINSARDNYDNKISSFNHTDLLHQVQDMSEQLTGTNFSTYIDEINDFRDNFKKCFLPIEVLSVLQSLQTARASMEADLQRGVSPLGYPNSTWNTAATLEGDYLLLGKGVCSGDTTVYCAADSDCTGHGSCSNIGKYRCSTNGVSAQAVVHCTADVTCAGLGGGSYCLADTTRATDLQTSLTYFGTVSLPSVSSITNKLLKLINDEYDTSSVSGRVSEVAEDLQLVDTSTYLSSIDETLAGIQSFSMTDINSTLEDMKISINSVNFSDFNGTLGILQSKRASVLKYVDKYVTFLDDFTDYIYAPGQLRADLTALSYANLAEFSAANTAGVTSRHVGTLIQAMYQKLKEMIDPIKSDVGTLPDENITKAFELANDLFDRGSVHPSEYGSLYYLMSQASATREQIVLADDPTASSVTLDKDGNSYPNGTYCLTRSCFQQTQDDYTTSTSSSGLPLSVSAIVGLVFAPLGIVFLVGLWTALCPLCCKSNNWRACPATCMLVLIIAVVPWYLLGSAFLLPMTIVVNDGCTSDALIANNYLDAYGDALCAGLGGDGTLDSCVQDFSGFNLTVSIQGMVNGVFGDCPTVDPFKTLIKNLADQANDVVNNKTATLLAEDSLKDVRQPVKNIIQTGGNNTGRVLLTFLDGTADVIDCPGIASVRAEFKKPICETFVGSLGWFAAMLYLAAWTLCCVGIPAGCCVQHNHKWAAIEEKSKLALVCEDGNGAAAEGQDDETRIVYGGGGGSAQVNGDMYVRVMGTEAGGTGEDGVSDSGRIRKPMADGKVHPSALDESYDGVGVVLVEIHSARDPGDNDQELDYRNPHQVMAASMDDYQPVELADAPGYDGDGAVDGDGDGYAL
jgi:hypothetical protein